MSVAWVTLPPASNWLYFWMILVKLMEKLSLGRSPAGKRVGGDDRLVELVLHVDLIRPFTAGLDEVHLGLVADLLAIGRLRKQVVGGDVCCLVQLTSWKDGVLVSRSFPARWW